MEIGNAMNKGMMPAGISIMRWNWSGTCMSPMPGVVTGAAHGQNRNRHAEEEYISPSYNAEPRRGDVSI